MSLIELFLIAVGLAMDAFAVSICKGLALTKIRWRDTVIIGLWFGGFQAFMPVIGFFFGVGFQEKIVSIDHWIAFLLLGFIGINMIREALSKDADQVNGDLGLKTMFLLAVATSIDALAVGVTFAFLQTRILPAVITIGVVTFFISVLGVRIGAVFGTRYKAKAEIFGGIILILLGCKILLEHLGFLPF